MQSDFKGYLELTCTTFLQTVRFKDELERNITIRLGYANAKIYKCDNDACPRPDCYRSEPSNKVDSFPCERPGCGGNMQVIRYETSLVL